jgi:hypothetical protein
MPQQAVAKGIGHTLDLRAQLDTRWNWVVRRLSVGRAASIPMVVCLRGYKVGAGRFGFVTGTVEIRR